MEQGFVSRPSRVEPRGPESTRAGLVAPSPRRAATAWPLQRHIAPRTLITTELRGLTSAGVSFTSPFREAWPKGGRMTRSRSRRDLGGHAREHRPANHQDSIG
ncbi:hypothetical protein HMPREF9946_05249 [Acetobacteraceae bacterium AT-5844]|nr:hypothetical protein HMPREF9946_05249 [Acetobacteraceae bacterium AT-5844]